MQYGQDQARLKQLKQTGHYIKNSTAQLMHDSRGQHFDRALRQFYAHILAICEKPESCVNHIHLTAILGGLAKAWAAAEARPFNQNHQQAVVDLHRFAAKIFRMLQPVCKALGLREASNLLYALSKLSINPDRMVAGTMDAIAQQLMANMHLANMQDLAEVLAGYSMLQSTSCCEDLMQAVSRQLAIADWTHEGPASVSRIIYSLATIPAVAPSVELLDALCQRFGVLLKGCQAAEIPTAQSIAKTLWALSKLKHAPSDELAMSMVDRMVALCHVPGQQPTPLEASCTLLACAQLRLPVKQAGSGILADLVLKSDKQQAGKTYSPSTAWTLAVMGHLRQDQFALLLELLTALADGHGELLNMSVLKINNLGQVYQALDWLHPPSSAPAHQRSAWSSLQGKLLRLGPRPVPDKPYGCGNLKLYAALNQLQLPFKGMVVIQNYWVDAVLEPRDNKAETIILKTSSRDYIKNVPGR